MTDKEPLVSVLIPCYNVTGFVEKAIASVFKQTYANLEIWLIDDASTDNTLQKLRSYTDKRIRVVHFEQNTKKVGAVNDVLSRVNGEYICFQDADDWSEPERIAEQVLQFKQNEKLGICFTNFRFVGEKNYLPGRVAVTNEELREVFLHFGLKRENKLTPPMCPSMMISKAALQKTKGYDPYFAGRVAEDIHWVYRVLKSFEGVTVDKVLYNYSIRQGSLTQMQFEGKHAKYAYSWQLLEKIIYKDIREGIDVLAPENADLLKTLELEACEEALTDQLRLVNETRHLYQNSMSYKIGKFILTPLRLFKTRKK